MKSIDLAGSPVDTSEQLFQFAGQAPARSSSFPFFSSFSRSSAPVIPFFFPLFFFSLLSFQFLFDVPVISAFHLMEISPGCARAAHAARAVLDPGVRGTGRVWGSRGVGQEHPRPVGSCSGSVGELGAGEGPLNCPKPGREQEQEPILSWALLPPSSASFLPSSSSPPSPFPHLHPPSISIPLSSIPLPSPPLHPIPPQNNPEDTENGARGVPKQLSQPSSPWMKIQPQTSPTHPQNPGKTPVKGWEEPVPKGKLLGSSESPL